MKSDPVSKSKYMGSAKAQIPLRISDEMIRAAKYHIEKIDGTQGINQGQSIEPPKDGLTL